MRKTHLVNQVMNHIRRKIFMRRRRRLRKRKQDSGAPKWMVTYSDMVTLVLVFFILLFSMSRIDLVKFQAISRSEEHTSELQSRGHLVCRLLLLPQHISTLFPYTTLFRSR